MKARYELVRRLSGRYGVKLLCEALGISRSGYYAFLSGKPGKRAQQEVAIRREILLSHTRAPSYGADNIHADVREKMVCGRNRVRRLMREMGIRSCRKRKYKATTNSRHSYKVAPNLLRETRVHAPNQVWVSDITYVAPDQGWLYLATVKDLFTREIVGFATGERITSELAQAALCQAVTGHRPAPGLIHHSDRGVQYCCGEYQALLKKHGILPSMSRKGNPYDNAVAENFFSCLKCEMVFLHRFKTRHEAALAIFRYIVGFYNKRRRHSALGRIPPAEFRKRWALAHGPLGAVIPAAMEHGVKVSAALDAG
jgi:transposase InsO family protein